MGSPKKNHSHRRKKHESPWRDNTEKSEEKVPVEGAVSGKKEAGKAKEDNKEEAPAQRADDKKKTTKKK